MDSSAIINLFPDTVRKSAFNQKKRLLIFWFAALALALGAAGAMAGINLYAVTVFRDRSLHGIFAFLSCAVGVLFACGSILFFSVKYRFVKFYVKMLKSMDAGLKDETELTFRSYDEAPVFKDGVYFYTMITDSKPLRRDDITERRVLIEEDVKRPELKEGDKIKAVTHANILISYSLKESKQ